LPYRDFPLIYGSTDEIYDEDRLREMLKLEDEDPCADYYGHYAICAWAVVECKGKHLRNAIAQLEATVRKIRATGRTVNKAIVIADTFGNERSIVRRGNKLWLKKGGSERPITIDNIQVEGWQPEEVRRKTLHGY
jgi:hypothetical protein